MGKLDKKAFATILSIAVIVGFLSFIVMGSRSELVDDIPSENGGESVNSPFDPTPKNNNGNEEDPIYNDRPKVTYFYSDSCPFCDEVEKFITQNDIERSVDIEKVNIQSRLGSLELQRAARECGIETERLGVPFLYSEGECKTGFPPIVEELTRLSEDYRE